MNDELHKMLKYLRLRGLLENYDQYLTMAGKRRFSHGRLLEHVIKEEYELRRRNAHHLRLTKAKIPERFVYSGPQILGHELRLYYRIPKHWLGGKRKWEKQSEES